MKLAKSPVHAQDCVDKVNSAALDNKLESAKALERQERKPAIDAMQSGPGSFRLNAVGRGKLCPTAAIAAVLTHESTA